MFPEIRIIGVTGMPEVKGGDDLARFILEAADRQGTPLQDLDILVVTQKVVSKAEGRVVHLDQVQPSEFAKSLARQWGKDPRHVEVVLRESRRIVKMDRGVIITETRHGLVCANAGVDASNIPGEDVVSLLPVDPDASAQSMQEAIKSQAGVEVAVIISDSFGRPWREGITNVAIGVSSINPLKDYRGQLDAVGHLLQVTVVATADELASAADLASTKTSRIPVVIIRGLEYDPSPGSSKALLRETSLDLFR
ncbi:MAG: coenzyme F420-0:L-glutamate ligase [Chloroflexi bacterium]|nr:coenzyme F420-0:L-glutamate ligase [Chloroflexota bacterium]